MDANSTADSKPKATVNGRPKKPSPGFPLFAHANGRWCKKVRGNFEYFGKWSDDPKGDRALQQWLDDKDELLAGRPRRGRTDEITVADLVNGFITAKDRLVASGEMRQRTRDDYYAVCERIVGVFGKNRRAVGLEPADFAKLREEFARTHGPVALTSDITRTRVLFNWAFKEGHIAKPARYGQSFDKPSQKTLRLARAANGPRLFERHELWAMLYGAEVDGERVDGAKQPLRTMILLALNTGLGNSDIAQLGQGTPDLRRAWLRCHRCKTGIERKIPLWPETIEAITDWLKQRPAPKEPDAEELMFVTRAGRSWLKTKLDNPISKEMAKLLKRLGLHRPGLNFYALRHTFRTEAGGACDKEACDALMGHVPKSDDMSAVYVHRIADERLQAVVNHVHDWLFPRPTVG